MGAKEHFLCVKNMSGTITSMLENIRNNFWRKLIFDDFWLFSTFLSHSWVVATPQNTSTLGGWERQKSLSVCQKYVGDWCKHVRTHQEQFWRKLFFDDFLTFFWIFWATSGWSPYLKNVKVSLKLCQNLRFESSNDHIKKLGALLYSHEFPSQTVLQSDTNYVL